MMCPCVNARPAGELARHARRGSVSWACEYIYEQRMCRSCTGAYLIASCQQEVQDAGILIAEEVLSKLLIFFVELQTCSKTSRSERCWKSMVRLLQASRQGSGIVSRGCVQLVSG